MKKEKLINVFEHFNIPFWTEGKNVSEGSIGIQCPFCNDTSNHCGVFEDTNLFSCWRCNEKGSLFKLIQKLTHIPYNEFEEIVGNIDINFKTSASEQIEEILEGTSTASSLYNKIEKIEFPKYSVPITKNTRSKLLEKFLSRREISINTCIEYRCRLCELGEYSHRMIIPVYWFLDKLTGYQAVDLTGWSKLKYKTSHTSINDYLYNYSTAYYGDSIILVEGVFDVWRLEGDTVCSFGTHLTSTQQRLIVEMKPKELIFCWDSDAYWEAREQARWFAPFVDGIKIVKFPEGEDPDSLGKEETFRLIEETAERR